MAGISDLLLQVLQGTAGAQNAITDENKVINTVLESMRSGAASSKEAIGTKTAATDVVEQTALAAEQQAVEAANVFARAAGTKIGTPEDVLVQLGNQLRAHIESANMTQDSIHAKESAKIIDNPLTWLYGQVTLPQDYQAYNQSVEKANVASRGISTLTTATDEVLSTQRGLMQKTTDASRAAVSEARKAQAQLEIDVLERAHGKDELMAAAAIQQNASATAALKLQEFGIVKDAASFDMEQQKFAMYKEQFDWEKQTKALNLKTKQEADSVKQRMLNQYNIGARILGYPEETSWEYIEKQMSLGGQGATRISAAMESGGNTLATGGKSNIVTSSPGGAAYMFSKKAAPRLEADAAFAPMKKYFKDRWDNAYLGAGGNEAKAVALANEKIKKDAEEFTNNAVATGSFYAPPTLQSIYSLPSVQNTALYKKVLSTAGKDLTTAAPSPILTLAYEAAKSGTITWEEAVSGINEMYGQVININNVTKKFSSVGIPSQTSFKTKPDLLGVDNVTADLNNYSSVMRLFTIARARDQVSANPLLGLLSPTSSPFRKQDTTKPQE